MSGVDEYVHDTEPLVVPRVISVTVGIHRNLTDAFDNVTLEKIETAVPVMSPNWPLSYTK